MGCPAPLGMMPFLPAQVAQTMLMIIAGVAKVDLLSRHQLSWYSMLSCLLSMVVWPKDHAPRMLPSYWQRVLLVADDKWPNLLPCSSIL
jgi:hypothetical protein